MGEEVIETGVDELLAILKKQPNLSMTEAAKELKIPLNIIQTWVDFLVEEEILGIEYKFTTPYIYLNTKKKKEQTLITEEDQLSIDTFKDEFDKRASENRIPGQKVDFFWKNHVIKILRQKKSFFLQEVKKRGLMDPEALWKQYQDRVINMNM